MNLKEHIHPLNLVFFLNNSIDENMFLQILSYTFFKIPLRFQVV